MKRLLLFLLLGAAAALGLGCDAAESTPGTPAPSPAEPLPTVSFIRPPLPEGSALWLEVSPASLDAPVVTVHGKGLGPVFGLAFRLGFPAAVLGLDSAELLPALGEDAAYLEHARSDGLRAGMALRSPDLEQPVLDESTLLAVLRLRVQGTGEAPLRLEQVQVRRADGSFVPVAVLGGELRGLGGEL